MDKNSQLLCTFTDINELDVTIQKIQDTYTLVFNKIYILENVEDEYQLVLTYNVSRETSNPINPPTSTISVHRKKQTNTIYTINAINKLIENKIGRLDKNYKIDWEELRNSVLVTAYGDLKVVNTKLSSIFELPLDKS
jgi:archaellum component FlaC